MYISHEHPLVAGDGPCEKMTAGQCSVRVMASVLDKARDGAAVTRSGNKNICRMEPRHETGASHVTPTRLSDHLRTPSICVRL